MSSAPSASSATGMPVWLSFLMAAACGLIVANLYYAQPLLGPIADSLGLSRAAAGLIVTATQCAYGAGLLLIVPLSDRVENRGLIVASLVVTAAALAVAAVAPSASLFLAACVVVGLGAVAAQVIVPFAAHLSPEAQRGRVVGNVMSGLLLGIMLARPAASLVADHFGWHAIFGLSAVATLGMALALWRLLPRRQPGGQAGYGELLRSMGRLWLATPVLRLRGFYHACGFAAFSLFWTVVPLHLAAAPIGFSQTQIAWFALAGVAGAIAAPITGRLADRGFARTATPIAMLMMGAAFLIGLVHTAAVGTQVAVLLAAAIVLDMGVAASLLLGQRAIFALGAQVRGRLNGLFIAMFFVGGALGSSLGAWMYSVGGWPGACLLGLAMPVLSLVVWLVHTSRTATQPA
ncbi:MAG: MFS transporter [Aquincola sp.]|nr:MFS transporter [Aquincola sp.]